MFTYSKFGVITLAAALAIFGSTALAQQTQPSSSTVAPAQPNPQMRRMRRRGMNQAAHAFRQLNLTDQQQQQMRSIMQAQRQSTQAQRLELRQLTQKWRAGTLTAAETARAKELRQQLRQSRQGVQSQMMAVLTPDQKTQLETMIKARRENRGRFGPK